MRNDTFPYALDALAIPTMRLVHVERPDRVLYACPDGCWRAHLDAWCKARRDGNETAPEPMPYGHCMFDSPATYGMVPHGCTDKAMWRSAWEHNVRSLLDGWGRDLSKEKLDRIVHATVEARMKGQEVGAAPFVACIYATL